MALHALGRAVDDSVLLVARAPVFSIQTIAAPEATAVPGDNVDGGDGNSAGGDDDGYVVVTMTTATDGAAVPTTLPADTGSDTDTETDTDTDAAAQGHPSAVVANGECRLMGPFALFVQLGLGALAMLSLVFKRWRERPQRPVKIWFFDASKQVFGSVLVHMSNVFLSLLTSGRFSFKVAPSVVAAVDALVRRDAEPYVPNPCSFYLLNLAIDTTVGIPILILLLRLTTALVAHTPLGKPRESIQSGNYGHPPSAWWWFKQSILYFCGLFGMKICVLVIFLVAPWIAHVGDWALGWTEGNEQVQIVFVMMLFPLIMNAMQYYIIDSFIKEQPLQTPHTGDGHYDPLADSADEDDEGHHHQAHHVHHVHRDDGADGDDESSGDQRDGAGTDDDEELDMLSASDEALDASAKAAPPLGASVTTTVGSSSYDPDLDGDSRTVLGSSASQHLKV